MELPITLAITKNLTQFEINVLIFNGPQNSEQEV